MDIMFSLKFAQEPWLNIAKKFSKTRIQENLNFFGSFSSLIYISEPKLNTEFMVS